jgi:UDP:flavonoid glycosyltransferase YjiC (YdhE family)
MPAEKRGVPWIVPDLFPMLVPSANNAPAGFPSLGRPANRAVWRLARRSMFDRFTFGRDFKAFRRKVGLPVPDGWNVVDARLSPKKTFAMVSQHYMPSEPDWPAGYHLTGFTPWAGPDGGAIGDDVEAFLAEGPPPVLVTLGTLGPSARPEVFTHVARALDEIGERGLFLLSMAKPDGIGPQHGAWSFVPLQPLLPRVKAIVQSGSHGTNALALGAGVPSVLSPCLFDQQWHAKRQRELGTGLWARKPKDIAPAIQRIVRDPVFRERAGLFANLLATEDGVTNAADEIESSLG